MELFKHLVNQLDFSECKSLVEVSQVVYEAIEDLEICSEDVLDCVLDEIKIGDIDELFEQLDELDDAERYSETLGEILEFEEMAAKHGWNVADVVVGLMQLHAEPDLSEHLAALPYSLRLY